MKRRSFRGPAGACMGVLAWMIVLSLSSAPCLAVSPSADKRLAAAERVMRESDRYLHQSELRRGMKGYGLTVMIGTEVVRFDVEIISVMTNWGPHQDVILARLSGQNLEKTGVISGMSGSPCYISHEGKDKLIGAVAYGWGGETEPICGIQPISQMLAVAGVGLPSQPTTETKPATEPTTEPAATELSAGRISPEFLAVAMDPHKRDFSRLTIFNPARSPRTGDSPGLTPLLTPLSVSGVGRVTVARMAEALRPHGIVPIQSGGVTSTAPETGRKSALVAGGAISIPLVVGDADFSSVGTVTAIVDGKVLAFGHSFYSDGDVSLPMGPGYIHTVLPHLFGSFKLGSTMTLTGTLDRDEEVAVVGRAAVGPPPMIPMTVQVTRPGGKGRPIQSQHFSYRVARHQWFTTFLVGILTADGVRGWANPPEHHTVKHVVEIDFGELGKFRAENVTSGMETLAAMSDVTRALSITYNNPLGPPPEVKEINISLEIEAGSRSAKLLELKLDGEIYRPGETVTGNVTILPYRKPRTKLPVRFALPEDLPDGTYTLSAENYMRATSLLQNEMPHKFDPRTVEQLMESLRLIVKFRGDRLYLRLPIKRGGVALRSSELPDLPPSRRAMLLATGKLDTHSFTRSIVRSIDTEYVLSGTAGAAFQVQSEPTETLIRQK